MTAQQDPLPAAWEEFRAAARAAHQAQKTAQETARRYAAAVKRLSEVAIGPDAESVDVKLDE